MSFSKPNFRVPRQAIKGIENIYVKMFDPPTASPDTPERLAPTNPVPEFMESLGLSKVSTPHTVTRDLLHMETLSMWDGKNVMFYTFRDADVLAPYNGGHFPGPTIRVPRGVVFHGKTGSHGPPPHTIHWHGIEPTPMNDGVGHCSMELGSYTYQWQPNFIGSYFYHCHRNTMQHFEFGLYGFLIIEPPDAYANPATAGIYPRRTAASVAQFKQFPGFIGGDPQTGAANGDPHAYTIPYDAEALWVIDDVDSVWREQAEHAFQTFPKHGKNPGIDDEFHANVHGNSKFFAFHDFNPDYFFVTGVPFRGPVGSTAYCDPNVVIPAAINSGVTGMQVSVNAKVNQTILIRSLCAAYVGIKVTFPVDVVIIAFDGRALGVPPFGSYNEAFLLPAGKAYELSTARRFDVLMRSDKPVNGYANVEFRHNRGNAFLMNGRIPITIA